MPNRPLFRAEARPLQNSSLYGAVIRVRPLSATVFSILGGSCVALVVGFLLFGSYTERTTVNGSVVAVDADVAQPAAPDRPPVTTVPGGSKLRARLDVPSSAVPFVNEGDRVLLRYEAYPYRRYGQQEGIVATAGQVVARVDPAPQSRADAEPVFQVTVDLPSQTLSAFGKEHPLYPGMPLQAEIRLGTRTLWDWARD